MTEIGKNKTRNNILKVGSKNLNVENWAVYHPDGTHMFTCGEKKARWYLERKLAKKTSEDKIQLTFTPKGNGFESNEIFGKSVRKSICVVTGVSEGLQRHHIVPYCYRTYFPEEYKSKNHHDVVLIHYEKHSEYELEATRYKDEIARMYDVKTIKEFNIEYTGKLREAGKKNVMILNNIHSLFKTYGKVSDKIKMEKLKMISRDTEIPLETICNYNYLQIYKMYLLLKEAHEYDMYEFKGKNRIIYDHGYHVVQKLIAEDSIEEFVKLWRHHFINIMKPKYMPTGWSIDFRVKTNI
jgi:hypothetical protein